MPRPGFKQTTFQFTAGHEILIKIIFQNQRPKGDKIKLECEEKQGYNSMTGHVTSEKATNFEKISHCFEWLKGQLISKCPFGVIVSTKVPINFFLEFLS